MVAPFDLTKFRKTTIKKMGVNDGFFDPITWIDTGNFALNRMISGDFRKGIPLGAVTVLAGESGSGKSYIVSGNIVRNAQKMGITPIIMDSEGALYEDWVRKLGVDVDPEKIIRAPVSMIDTCAEVIEGAMTQYREVNMGKPREEMQKLLFVIDSLGALQTPTEVEQFQKHDMKGDLGKKPRQLKALVLNCIRLFTGFEVGLVATNHTYSSQDQYKPDVVSGGGGFIYMSSIVATMNKKKLTEDVKEGKATKKVTKGIIASIRCEKTRFTKPFEKVDIEIPYDKGMDPYSGVFDIIKQTKAVSQSGSWYTVTFKDGTTYKQQGGDTFPTHILDRLMDEFNADDDEDDAQTGFDHTPEGATDDE